MSELLQSGQFSGASGHHPDADQLSAFMEQALPAHEREQVLAHLAHCADCRETVALSLPALEATPAPAPARRPWLRGWSIFVPAALALAASVVFVVHMRHINPSVGMREQIAVSQRPLQMTTQPQQQVPAPPPPAAHAKAVNQSAPAIAPAAAFAAGVAQRRQLDEPAAAPQRAPEPAPPPPAAITGENLQSAPIQQQVQPQVLAQAPANRFTLAEPAPRPPAPSANASVGSAAQTVTVASEPKTLDVTPTSGEMVLALPTVRFKNPLPSGLAVSSIAASGQTLLAIDAHNAVFLSVDLGGHWTAVSAPWRDRAVHVSLVSRVQTNVSAMGAMSGRGLATFANAARLQAATGASLSGVITDETGAVVSGASITVRNAATSARRTVTTDASGHYRAEGLAPGSYSIEAAAPGFATQRVADVAVDASSQITKNLTLQVGSVSQSVNVAPQAEPTASPSPAAAKSEALKSSQAAAPQPVFEITTDTGQRWTSADGILWQRK